ncbi:hypothetical protein [Desulfurispora thermophila]|uniref:hypothetical protein n=1 Tax=Desulfurispora thermophila TaxID=265470 RepID=UPI00036FE423|nr:hypothetical protein [Desulfurispora thermophila]
MKPGDSVFAKGMSMTTLKAPVEIESVDYGGYSYQIVQLLAEAEAFPVLPLTYLLECNKKAVEMSLMSLWHARIVNRLLLWTRSKSLTHVCKLWVATDVSMPKTPDEACRLAALGLFYAKAKKEIPGLEWKLYRNTKSTRAEMTLQPPGKGKLKLTVAAPRRDEQPGEADIYIFPTPGEAQQFAASLKGKRFTSDLLLLENMNPAGVDINQLIYEF